MRLKALQKLEASIDVITTTAMVAKVDKALQAFGGGSPDPRVQATVARIRTKAAAKDVSAGTKALRRLRRRHKLKVGGGRGSACRAGTRRTRTTCLRCRRPRRRPFR